MTFLSTCLRTLLALSLPLTLSAQFGELHTISRTAGAKTSLHSADLNGDGLPDLLVGAANFIYWLPNAGDGTGFYPPRTISGEGGVAVAGDIDQDGDLDLACLQGIHSSVNWFRNDGQGGFTLAANWGAPNEYFINIALADLDHDADLDIVTTGNLGNPDIRWYKNTGGVFSNAIPVFPGTATDLIKVLDVDSDGDPDLVYNNFAGGKWSLNTDGQGTTWSTGVAMDGTKKAAAADLADIDGDGLNDLVTILSGSGLVWLKRTAGGFDPPKKLVSGVLSELSLCVGDPDEDGDMDVFGSGKSGLILYRNTGGGVFQNILIDTMSEVNGMILDDLNGDGHADLATISGNQEKVLWYVNNGNAQFGPPQPPNADYNYTDALALADLDMDGDLDVIAANGNASTLDPTIRQLFWYENQGGLIIRQHSIAFNWADFSHVQVADFDGDKDPDILAGSGSPFNISWFENDGKGGFAQLHTLASSTNSNGITPELLVTDLDADGDPDVVYCFNSGTSTTFWFQNLDGAGHFSPVKQIASLTYSNQITSLDVNGDLAPDLIVSSVAGLDYIWVCYADSPGKFTKQPVKLAKTSTAEDMKIGDLDGDGKADLAVINLSGLYTLLSSKNFMLHTLIFDTQFKGKGVAITDVDLDGDNDLVVYRSDLPTAYIQWYENADGLGNFNPPAPILSGLEDYQAIPNLVFGRFDADDDPDLVFSSGHPQQIFWLENEVAGSRTISGRCFWDLNANGQPESNEAGLQQLPVQVSPLPRSVYSNADGLFHFYVPPGVFELNYLPQTCQTLTTPATQTANTLDASVDSVFFGVKYNPGVTGMQSWLLSSHTRCHSQVGFRLVLENTGCSAESGTVTLHLSDLAAFVVSSPYPQQISADSLSWNFTGLAPGNRYEISLNFNIAGADHLGDAIRMQVSTRNAAGITPPGWTPFSYASTIFCAYDPNDKQVWPTRGADNRVNDGEELLYTIRFQNTGTDTATRVVIRDRLAPELDWSTLRPLAATHPFTASIDGQGFLEFRFDPIVLPDSARDQAGSQGFVSFKVRLKPGLPLNTVISNTADIYFDQNLPVATNTVSVRRYDAVTAAGAPAEVEPSIRLYPNPFTETLHFQWNTFSDAAPVRLEIRETTQRLVASVRLPDSEQGTVELPGLPPGLYLCRIVREGDKAVLGSGKLVRM